MLGGRKGGYITRWNTDSSSCFFLSLILTVFTNLSAIAFAFRTMSSVFIVTNTPFSYKKTQKYTLASGVKYSRLSNGPITTNCQGLDKHDPTRKQFISLSILYPESVTVLRRMYLCSMILMKLSDF